MAQIKGIIPAQYFEVIRDRIAEILADELDGQVLLTYDTDLEVKGVYVERSVPFDNTEMPAINVSFSGGDYNNQTVRDADGSYSFFIDVFTQAKTTDDDRGDKLAMFKLHKLLGVCRAIIQNPIYKTLGFEPPFIMSRQISSIVIAAPKEGEALKVVMGRLILAIVAPEDTQLLTAELIAGFDTQVKLALTDKGYIYSGDNIPVPPVTDGKVTVNSDDFGTVAEGDTLNVPVVNTYDEELGSLIMQKWVIEDQQYEDTDGTPKTVPAGNLIICTPSTPINQLTCQELNDGLTQSQRQVIQRIETIKTGQTTSYAAGDDGDRENGRAVDFFTLNCNNSFGNTNRFTDINGLQVYGDDYVIDHLTGLGWFRLRPFAGSKNWADSIAAIEANTTIGFSDWFMPNINEFLSLINNNVSNGTSVFNYAPVNNFGVTASYTSSTQINVTTNALTVQMGAVTFASAAPKTTLSGTAVQCRKHF